MKSAKTIALYEFRNNMQFDVPDLSDNRHHAHIFRLPQQRLSALTGLSRGGRHGEAASLADRMMREPSPVAFFYDIVCVLSESANAALQDEKLNDEDRAGISDGYAARAIKILRGLVPTGYFKIEENRQLISADHRLDSLRHRDEFREFAKSIGVELPSGEPK